MGHWAGSRNPARRVGRDRPGPQERQNLETTDDTDVRGLEKEKRGAPSVSIREIRGSRTLYPETGIPSPRFWVIGYWGSGVGLHPRAVISTGLMRRAVGTRGGWEDGGPTVGTVGWDETSRCDGGGWLRRGFGLFVICYWGSRAGERGGLPGNASALAGGE